MHGEVRRNRVNLGTRSVMVLLAALLLGLLQVPIAAQAADPPSCGAGEWTGEYFGNKTLSGSPALVRCDPTVDFTWAEAPEGVPVGPDDFSVRWTTTRTFAAGTYQFDALSDDGIRVRVDGQLVIDAWKDQPPTAYQGTITLTEGSHTVVVEYYEGTGAARARVGWTQVGDPGTPPTCGSSEWTGEYFGNRTLSGSPALVRCDPTVDFTWPDAPAGVPVGVDNFSARWTTTRTFAAGTYQFDALSDDGIRVRVDGQLVIDAWKDQPPTAYQGTITLTEGSHTVVVEYYEGADAARVRVGWTQVGDPGTPPSCGSGEWAGEYFGNRSLSGSPVLVRCDAAVDFTWPGVPAGVPVGADEFSVRWTTTRTFAAGTYRFDALADDGIRVFVDGQLVIDGWKDQPASAYSATRTLTAGSHTVVVEYFEGAGAAWVRAFWSPVTAPPAVDCSKGRVISFIAHIDDDLLFMNPSIQRAIADGKCVRTVAVTAGDAGFAAPYWGARELGHRAAYAVLAGVADDWTFSDAGVSGRSIEMATNVANPKVSLVWMRLPDSNPVSQMRRLWSGEVGSLNTVDGRSTYTRDGLTSALLELATDYSATEIKSHNYVSGDGDHQDHFAVAQFTKAAVDNGRLTDRLTGYVAYPISSRPVNVSGADLAIKTNAFYAYAAYDSEVCSTPQACAGTAFADWLLREYTVDGGVAPQASWTPANSTVQVGQSATFSYTCSAGSTGAISSLPGWIVPAGGTSLKASPKSPGSAKVTVTCTDGAGRTASASTTVTAVAAPTATWSASSVSVQVGQSATFSYTCSAGSTGAISSLPGWIVPAGGTSLKASPKSPGSAKVTVTCTDGAGRTASASTTVTAVAAPAPPGPVKGWLLRDSASPGSPGYTMRYAAPGATALACDLNGDGRDSNVAYQNGTWYGRTTLSEGAPDLQVAYGFPGAVPVCGDWDGNGTDTLGVYFNGVWYLRNSNTPGPANLQFSFGFTGTRPVVGDWDGNGRDGIGIYHPATGTWYTRQTASAGSASTVRYGWNQALPVPGDWDGNGTDTLGVFHNGQWLLRDTLTSGPATRQFSYGWSGTTPITGNWDGKAGDGIGVTYRAG